MSSTAVIYNDKSILENMHVSSAFQVMQQDGFSNIFAFHRHGCAGFRFLDYLGVDLNPGVSLLGELTTPGFKSALG